MSSSFPQSSPLPPSGPFSTTSPRSEPMGGLGEVGGRLGEIVVKFLVMDFGELLGWGGGGLEVAWRCGGDAIRGCWGVVGHTTHHMIIVLCLLLNNLCNIIILLFLLLNNLLLIIRQLQVVLHSPETFRDSLPGHWSMDGRWWLLWWWSVVAVVVVCGGCSGCGGL